MNPHNIKNYLFDLGNVLLDIDIERSKKAFEQLGIGDLMTHFYTSEQAKLINEYETGVVTTEEFCAFIRQRSDNKVKDEEILYAWNTIICDYRVESIEYIKTLSKTSKIFLLSNTNASHYELFTRQFLNLGMGSFDELFNHTFYSHQIGLRKPDSAIYEYVLKEANILAEETLFIDDLDINIEAASKLGIQTLHLKSGMRVEKMLVSQ